MMPVRTGSCRVVKASGMVKGTSKHRDDWQTNGFFENHNLTAAEQAALDEHSPWIKVGGILRNATPQDVANARVIHAAEHVKQQLQDDQAVMESGWAGRMLSLIHLNNRQIEQAVAGLATDALPTRAQLASLLHALIVTDGNRVGNPNWPDI